MGYYDGQVLASLKQHFDTRLYEIRVQQRHSQTVDQVRVYGRFTTGRKHIDADLGNSIVFRHIKINDMVEYYKESIPFCISKGPDRLTVYTQIMSYFDALIEYLENELSCAPIDVEYITTLDRIAMELHSIVHTENRDLVVKQTGAPASITFLSSARHAAADPAQHRVPRWQSRIPRLSSLMLQRHLI